MDMIKLSTKESRVAKMMEAKKIPLSGPLAGCLACVFHLEGLGELSYDEQEDIRYRILNVRHNRLRQVLEDLGLDVSMAEKKIGYFSDCRTPQEFIEKVAELLPDED